jgi:hypothetical protein
MMDPQSNYQNLQQPLGYDAQGQQQAAVQYTPPTQGVPLYADLKNPDLNNKFISQGYKDAWAAIAFAVQILATVIWAIVSIATSNKSTTVSTPAGPATVTTNTNLGETIAGYTAGATAAAAFLCALSLCLMRFMPNTYIWIANGLCVLVYAAGAIYALTQKVIAYAVCWALCAAAHALWLFFVRRRIPFAGVLLKNAVGCIMRYYGTIICSFTSLIILIVYVVLFVLMTYPTFMGMTYGTTSKGVVYAALFLFLLMFNWSTQVITNVVHVTTSGTVATWYFVGEQSMPSNPTMASLKRAMTTSFGSICFGSLIIALLKTIHYFVRSAARRGGLAALVFVVLLRVIERLIEYFNIYAFTHVAIYGSSYIEAAKQTWEMIKKCGVAAVFNDNLVFPVMSLTALINSLGLGFIFGFAASSGAVGIIAFLVTYVIHIVVLRCVYSAIVTIFVCFAECPDVLIRSNPEFNVAIQAAHALAQTSAC